MNCQQTRAGGATSSQLLYSVVPLMVLITLGACSSNPPVVAPRPASDVNVITPERGTRGNPQQYEVFGRTYAVMHSSDGYRDTGVASWYGRDFHGRPTSSGEPYDMYLLTAAHKSLPLPTWVEVTNQRNGKSVIVKVNDRGPFVDDRIIDLSYAAAMELEMIRDGTAPVFVRALGAPATLPVSNNRPETARLPPATRTAPAAVVPRAATRAPARDVAVLPAGVVASPAPVSAVGRLGEVTFVQVGAFGEYSNAARLLARLESSGYNDALVATESSGDRQIHRVRVGPQFSRSASDLARDELRRSGFTDAQVVTVRSGE